MRIAVMTQRFRKITPRANTSSIVFGGALLAVFSSGFRVDLAFGSCGGNSTMLEYTVFALVAGTLLEEDAWTIVVVLACLSFIALTFEVVLTKFCNVGHNFGSGRVGAFAASGSSLLIFP